jgi:hypothetical protein
VTLADGDEMDRVEEHLFACGECSARLHRLAAFGPGLATLVRQGRVSGIVSRALLNRMQRDGIHVRMYSLVPGETVPCAVFPGDDLVVAALRADFSGVDAVTLSGDVARRLAKRHDRRRARVRAGRRGALGYACRRRASDAIHAAAAHARVRRRHARRTRQVRASNHSASTLPA